MLGNVVISVYFLRKKRDQARKLHFNSASKAMQVSYETTRLPEVNGRNGQKIAQRNHALARESYMYDVQPTYISIAHGDDIIYQ